MTHAVDSKAHDLAVSIPEQVNAFDTGQTRFVCCAEGRMVFHERAAHRAVFCGDCIKLNWVGRLSNKSPGGACFIGSAACCLQARIDYNCVVCIVLERFGGNHQQAIDGILHVATRVPAQGRVCNRVEVQR